MIAFFGSMASIAFIVFLILAIRSKKKGLPKARQQFNIMWVSLAMVILLMIIDPNKGQPTKTAQPEQVATQEVAKAEPVQSETTTTEPVEKASEPVTKTNTEPATTATGTKVTEKEEKSIPGSIGMTPTEFRKAFNKHSSELGTDLKISKINVEKGPVQDTFTQNFSDDLVLLGSVNKADGSVREISLITQAKTASSAGDFLVTFGILALATNPNSDPNAAKIVGEQLGIFKDGVDFSTLDTSTTYDGIEYKMKAYEGMGFMLFVRDPNDEG